MLNRYTDNRLLFLTDAEFEDLNTTNTVPVIDGWSWKLQGDGTGFLEDPVGRHHCNHDLMFGTIQFEPDGSTITAPGLDYKTIQEMGEKYAYNIVFTDDEKQKYDEHIQTRTATKKDRNLKVREQIGQHIKLEYKHGDFIGYVDCDGIMRLSGIEYDKQTCSKDEAIELFNRVSDKLHADPLRNPIGFMEPPNNVHRFVRNTYHDKFNNILQAIDNNIIDGSGIAVDKVLQNIDKTVNHDMSQYVPDGVAYVNFKFVPMTDQYERVINKFVDARVSKTLIYEQRRGYDKETIDRNFAKLRGAGLHMKNTFSIELKPKEEETTETITQSKTNDSGMEL